MSGTPRTRSRIGAIAVVCACAAGAAVSPAGCKRSEVMLGSDDFALRDEGVGADSIAGSAAPQPTEPTPSVAGAAALGAGTGAVLGSAGNGSAGATGGAGTQGGAGMPAAGADAATPDDAPVIESDGPASLPTATSACPVLSGEGDYTFSAGGRSLDAHVYVAADAASKPEPGGPLILYWHGTGSLAAEIEQGVDAATIVATVAAGGVVAAFQASSTGCNGCQSTGTTWFVEDDLIADELVACAIAQARIDTRRIHAIGFSGGALHAMHFANARSGYVASVVSYSGGAPLYPALSAPQDPSNKVAALLTYGAPDTDIVIIDFNANSVKWFEEHVSDGHYTMLCNHGQGHQIPPQVVANVATFLADHPYKVTPEPYAAGIPAVFPAFCGNQP